MKTITGISTLALALILSSCGDNNSSTTTTTTTDSQSNASMTAAPPAATDSGMGAGANAPTGMSDQDFVTKASSANTAEIAMHKSAVAHAQSADVKMHAKHMLTDHQSLGDEMSALASKKGLTVSSDIPADKKQAMDDINGKKGKDFDMAYLDQQVRDHQEAISLFESGSASVKDADLKALIDKALPKLRSHLQMVQDAQSKMNQ